LKPIANELLSSRAHLLFSFALKLQTIFKNFTNHFWHHYQKLYAFMEANGVLPQTSLNENEDIFYEENGSESAFSNNQDTSKYIFNGDNNSGRGFSKGSVVKHAVEYYASHHPNITADELVDSWLSLGVKMPNLVETIETYNERTKDSKDLKLNQKSKIIELPNGESIHVSNQFDLERIQDFIDKVNSADWGITIEKLN
ncbi:MAG: hypothetical protein ACK5JU_06635, partial [Bacteroidales bacterium]